MPLHFTQHINEDPVNGDVFGTVGTQRLGHTKPSIPQRQTNVRDALKMRRTCGLFALWFFMNSPCAYAYMTIRASSNAERCHALDGVEHYKSINFGEVASHPADISRARVSQTI